MERDESLTPCVDNGIEPKSCICDVLEAEIVWELSIFIVNEEDDRTTGPIILEQCSNRFVLCKLVISLLGNMLSLTTMNTLRFTTPSRHLSLTSKVKLRRRNLPMGDDQLASMAEYIPPVPNCWCLK